jgi:uncharacterized membrane protein
LGVDVPRTALLVVALYFFCGGIGHFIFADFLVSAMPSYLPFHIQLIYLSGIFELLGAVGILVPRTRIIAANGLIALCVAVFPANINMALHSHLFPEIPLWLLYLRLPFQLLLMWFIRWAIGDEVKAARLRKTAAGSTQSNIGFEKQCIALSQDFGDLLEWTWDERYSIVLSEFGKDKEDQVHEILEKHFKCLWSTKNITSAPAPILRLVKSMGGMQDGQILFTTHVVRGEFVFCALWPWGNNKSISIRLSPVQDNATQEQTRVRIEKLRSWFTIKTTGSGWIKINPE